MKTKIEHARLVEYLGVVRRRRNLAVSVSVGAFALFAIAASDAHTLERGVVSVPTGANAVRTLAFGAVVALAAGLGVALARDYVDGGGSSVDEWRKRLDLAPVVPAPRVDGERDAAGAAALEPVTGLENVAAAREPWRVVSRAFHSLGANVLHAVGGRVPRVIMMTSPHASEAKTDTSLSFATTLAESGARVVLIDSNLRHPRCHDATGLPNETGLSSVLEGTGRLERAIRRLSVPGLYLLPAGPVPSDPARLLSDGALVELLVRLGHHFDFVIIDGPPALATTDALLVAEQSDGVVLAVKRGGALRGHAREARDRLAPAGADFLGVVVNDASSGWRNTPGGR